MTKKSANIEAGLEDYNPFDPASQQRSGIVSFYLETLIFYCLHY